MEQSTLYLLGLAGILIHYLKDYEECKKAGKKYSLAQLLPTIVLSVLTTMLLIFLRKDIENLYVITSFSAVILGYFGNSVFFSFVNAKKPTGVNLSSKPDVVINEVLALPETGVDGEWYHIEGNKYYYWDGRHWQFIVGGRPNDRP